MEEVENDFYKKEGREREVVFEEIVPFILRCTLPLAVVCLENRVHNWNIISPWCPGDPYIFKQGGVAHDEHPFHARGLSHATCDVLCGTAPAL